MSVDVERPTVPAPRTCPYTPPDLHRALYDRHAVVPATLPGGRAGWAVTDLPTIRAMLVDPRFSSDRGRPGFPQYAEGHHLWLISMDAPEHTRARRDVITEFTSRRMEALRTAVERIVHERIDAMLAGPRPVDLVRALSLPVPSSVICALLGVPYQDHELFEERTRALVENDPAVILKAAADIRAYLGELVRAKQRDPDPADLLGRQVLKLRAEGREDHGDLVELAFILLVAGHETTANMISLSALALIRDPALADALRSAPERIPAAVEELLRLFTIVESPLSRIATEDVELAGVHIRAGDGVIALATTGNHDPSLFPEPERILLGRDSRKHIAFGHGPHQCLGKSLARVELQVTLSALVTRIPGLRLAEPDGPLRLKTVQRVFGLDRLPVTWG
ncbi:cytochrome P450 [Pseudonocardia eucalypti]|uniref:Cytochrome P450 n=1 Tax=Pseudonocardia eucalypti TaxID=648755 RepID=A0ABP9REI3_9PSEU|nr:cytochrome P450 [Pseudonocardia eucalypti]